MAPPRPQTGAMSPPPSLKYHMRRKSGQTHTTKKTNRPALSRRQTTATHIKSSSKTSPPPRCETADIFDFDDSEESESFFNFCTSCDKQLPADCGHFLYCSERCRLNDLPSNTQKWQFPASPPLTPFAMTFPALHERKRSEGRDIVPRFSPSPYNDSTLLSLDSTSAVNSLRSLSRALENTGRTPSTTSVTRPSPQPTLALPRRPSFSSSESEEDSEDEEEYQRLHRRVPSTPHPGAAIYGTYLKPSPKTYSNNLPLPRKGSGETYKPRSVDLVTPVLA